MDQYIIEGGNRLSGEVKIQGAKNSCLPVLAATVLSEGESVIHNCPTLLDTEVTRRILEHLGCCCSRQEDAIVVDASSIETCEIPTPMMREMRSSIVFLGAVASRCGRCRLSYPGGCEIGQRPIDLHLSALRQMGMQIHEDHGFLECRAERGFHGAEIALSFPSVGATENIILAAARAKGTTVVTNAACEPEIADLADYLNRCGARISGAGEGTLTVEGVECLHPCEHTVIPDRIVAATYLAAAAITGGSITLTGVNARHLQAVLPIFEQMGCSIRRHGEILSLNSGRILRPANLVRTTPYPGFPTDAQAILMALSTVAHGTTVFVENIFENRYKHVVELQRMGARIQVEGRVAVVEGMQQLHSAPVSATDLRGGAALVLAGLCAEGVTEISEIHYIDRGYERLEQTLSSLGACIRRS